MNKPKQTKQVRKRFKPNQRQRKRYIVVVLDAKRTFECLKKTVKDACNADAKLIGFNDRRTKVMVCVPRRCINEIKAALKIDGFNCIGVSGMIKRAGQKWMKEG